MTRRNRLLLSAGIVLFATGYFVLDVRQRARIDRSVKSHRTDFTVYQYASRALVAGEDPYEATNPRGYRYVYPPLLAILLMPIAGWDPANAALIFFVISAAALLYALLALMSLRSTGSGPPLGWPAVLLAAFTCLGFAHQGFQRGQITHILLALHVGALVALLKGRFTLAGIWLALGGALRLTPLLAAAAVGVGLVVAAVRGQGFDRPLRFAAGLGVGLLLGFVLLPLLSLGAERAEQVTGRWVEVTRAVYAENADLSADYKINEWRFKNQAPRRIYGTWAGWATAASFTKERPALSDRARALSEGAATATGLLLLLLAVLLGALGMRSPGTRAYAVAFAAVTLLPVLITRYTWPTHYLMAMPAVALAAARLWRGRPLTWTRLILLGAALLFYAAHAAPLQFLGEAGVLMLGCALFLALLLWHGLLGRDASEGPEDASA